MHHTLCYAVVWDVGGGLAKWMGAMCVPKLSLCATFDAVAVPIIGEARRRALSHYRVFLTCLTTRYKPKLCVLSPLGSF